MSINPAAGCWRNKFSMLPETGLYDARDCAREDGHFNMKIRIIRMSMIPPSSACCWPGTAIRRIEDSIDRAREWIIGMQSKGGGRFDGGWGAFEPENIHLHFNHIPFADHGALLDPPTSDVTARCVSFLAQIGMTADDPVMARALAFLRREQEADGSWFGRWGTNYIYGTWSVLCALNAVGLSHDDPAISRAVDWLVSVQRDDGGWGEDEETYRDAPLPAATKNPLPAKPPGPSLA